MLSAIRTDELAALPVPARDGTRTALKMTIQSPSALQFRSGYRAVGLFGDRRVLLRHVPDAGTCHSMGLVTSKTGALESAEHLQRWNDEAAKFTNAASAARVVELAGKVWAA